MESLHKTNLSSKKCSACHDAKPLNTQEVVGYIKQLHCRWIITQAARLYREYEFSNFIEAMKFANKVAELAEEEGHHPEIIVSWGKCGIELWTHSAQGLTDKDFALAAKIEELR
jgi:4a-hydroxytetrahydrobiopterin dehydratase